MDVVVTEAAEADLERIGDWIAADNPARAVTFVVELRACCEQLAHSPRAYSIVSQFGRTGIRRRSYHDYLVFYRIRGNRIEILHILHGAQD
jgi:plasmid stabilization system protein ParE